MGERGRSVWQPRREPQTKPPIKPQPGVTIQDNSDALSPPSTFSSRPEGHQPAQLGRRRPCRPALAPPSSEVRPPPWTRLRPPSLSPDRSILSAPSQPSKAPDRSAIPDLSKDDFDSPRRSPARPAVLRLPSLPSLPAQTFVVRSPPTIEQADRPAGAHPIEWRRDRFRCAGSSTLRAPGRGIGGTSAETVVLDDEDEVDEIVVSPSPPRSRVSKAVFQFSSCESGLRVHLVLIGEPVCVCSCRPLDQPVLPLSFPLHLSTLGRPGARRTLSPSTWPIRHRWPAPALIAQCRTPTRASLSPPNPSLPPELIASGPSGKRNRYNLSTRRRWSERWCSCRLPTSLSSLEVSRPSLSTPPPSSLLTVSSSLCNSRSGQGHGRFRQIVRRRCGALSLQVRL